MFLTHALNNMAAPNVFVYTEGCGLQPPEGIDYKPEAQPAVGGHPGRPSRAGAPGADEQGPGPHGEPPAEPLHVDRLAELHLLHRQ